MRIKDLILLFTKQKIHGQSQASVDKTGRTRTVHRSTGSGRRKKNQATAVYLMDGFGWLICLRRTELAAGQDWTVCNKDFVRNFWKTMSNVFIRYAKIETELPGHPVSLPFCWKPRLWTELMIFPSNGPWRNDFSPLKFCWTLRAENI